MSEEREQQQQARPSHVALVGFMGCGKSTVGPLLAARLGARFVDTDARIVADAGGCDIPSLFAEEGEAAFRQREARAVAAACAAEEPAVIATGGGVVLSEENIRRLRAACHVVWLAARPDVIVARTAMDRNRPLLAGAQTEPEMLARVLTLLGERGPRYQSAQHQIVDTSDRDPEAIAREIERKFIAYHPSPLPPSLGREGGVAEQAPHKTCGSLPSARRRASAEPRLERPLSFRGEGDGGRGESPFLGKGGGV